MSRSKLCLALLVGVVPVFAAQADTVSGTGGNGLHFTASNNIIGQDSTATLAGGGDPSYFANPTYSGVVTLIMDEGSAGKFLCSGALLSDRRSILTAGHCVSGGHGTISPITTTAYFSTGANPDSIVYTDPTSVAVQVAGYIVNPNYTGSVIDQNDIAVLKLADAAPAFAQGYTIYNNGDLTGDDYNIAGYGQRSDGGGGVGADLGAGRLRQGDNRYDFRLGDPDFGGVFSSDFFGGDPDAQTDYSFISDFDNGTSANDASCQLAVNGFGLDPSSKYCDTGVGHQEVSDGHGDSGGPEFIDGQIASVTSYGLTFGQDYGDIDGTLDSSFGELNGFVPTYIHADFIANAEAVPEPAGWAMMLGGFAFVGTALRRRRTTVSFG